MLLQRATNPEDMQARMEDLVLRIQARFGSYSYCEVIFSFITQSSVCNSLTDLDKSTKLIIDRWERSEGMLRTHIFPV